MNAIPDSQTLLPVTEGQKNLDLTLRASLKLAIHILGLEREQLARELTKRVDRKISLAMIDAWTANSKQDWHIPADCIPALCKILQDETLQRQLLSPTQLRDLEIGESVTGIKVRLKDKSAKRGRKA